LYVALNTEFLPDNNGFIFQTFETTETHISFQANSIGKMFATVVAFNNAMEPSPAVCSDGINIDITPPTISYVSINGMYIKEGLAKTSNGDVYFVDKLARRYPIANVDLELEHCRYGSTVYFSIKILILNIL
jgi:hypothetical protein